MKDVVMHRDRHINTNWAQRQPRIAPDSGCWDKNAGRIVRRRRWKSSWEPE